MLECFGPTQKFGCSNRVAAGIGRVFSVSCSFLLRLKAARSLAAGALLLHRRLRCRGSPLDPLCRTGLLAEPELQQAELRCRPELGIAELLRDLEGPCPPPPVLGLSFLPVKTRGMDEHALPPAMRQLLVEACGRTATKQPHIPGSRCALTWLCSCEKFNSLAVLSRTSMPRNMHTSQTSFTDDSFIVRSPCLLATLHWCLA